MANKKELATGSNEIKERGSWVKPQLQQVKLNTYASWQKETGRAGLGFVARNHNGEVLLSGARVECYAASPLEAEAKAIVWAMTHALSKNFQNVVFESDSLCLVNALRDRSVLRQIACLFSQILASSQAFSTCNWSFVKREGNMVAHSIASWGLGRNEEIVLDGRVPDCTFVRATNDVLLSRI